VKKQKKLRQIKSRRTALKKMLMCPRLLHTSYTVAHLVWHCICDVPRYESCELMIKELKA